MKLTTTTYKQIIASGETRNWNIKIDITLADDTVLPSLTEADITQFSMETAISGDSTFDIGCAIIGMCKFTIENFRETYSQYDFFNATAVVWLKLVGDSEYHRMGFYTIDEPVFNGNMVSLELLDNMWKFDVPLSEVPIIYPISVGDAVSAICSYCGVVKATLSFNGDSFIVNEPEQDMNCREFLQYLAMIGCNFCVINPSGSLEIKWYQSVTPSEDDLDGGSFNTNTTPYSDGDSADGGNFNDYSSGDSYDGGTFTDNSNIDYFTRNFSVSQGTDEITITGVKIAIGDVEYSRGTEGYMLVLTNPFITDSNVSSFLNLVWGRLNGFKLRPFQISCLPDIAAEVGDYCAFTDAKGNMSYSWVTCINFNVSSMEVRCSAQSPTRTLTRQYSKAIQTAVEEARKVTDKGISDYDVMVQLMNNIAINAMGAYMDYEDIVTGGRIYYLSNRPITKSGGSCSFQSGSTVYKMSGDGFFVSTNGGQTWTNGYDSQTGNLVVNVLSAIGIVADWVQTGKIKDRYNINYWDLDTGDLRMTAGAKIRQTNPDYSGGYVPTNANAPALSWTTDELKQANVGKTFNNTSTTPATTYIYSVTEYPESAHPYNSSETAAYKFETGLTAPIKVVLNSQSKTESASYDWLDFFYTQSGTTYTRRIGGNIGGMEIIIPTSDFYLYWRTDSSVTDWGWKIDSIESTSGSPEGFSTTTLPSYSWTVVGGKYAWKEATLDNYVGGIASGIIPTGVELTQEEVFNALTNGQQDQGIYIYNGQVYLNASMMNTGYLSANLVNAGSLLADRIHGGTLVIGGDVSQDGKIYLVSNSSTLSTDTNIYSKTASFSYNYTGSLGKYAVSFVISGLSKNDVTFNYSIDRYTSGSSTEVSNGSFNMGAGTNVFTIPYEFNITSTSSSSLYFTIYIESVNSGGSSNKFNLSINYGKIITSLDKNGIKTTSLTADGDCTFGNLYIGKKTVSPWGANIETSYIYSTGYKEYFYRTWRSLTNNRDYYYYFYVCPKADGWTSNCDINVYVNGDDTGSHTTAVYRVAKQTWNGSSWVESEYKTWDIDGDLKHGSTDYFTGFSASDSTTYRFEVKITGYSWASNYEVDIYTDPQHILELSNYGNTGSFSGQISGNGNFTNLSFGGFEFTDTQHKLINHSIYETIVMSNNAESVHVDIAYDNIRKNGTTPVMWDSSSDVRMKKNIHDLDVELSREIIDGTQPKSFEYIKEEGVHYGMIAQEARALLDSLGETDARLERTANMPDEETGIEDQRTIYYQEYIPHIINYIKRQEAEINELKAEIKALKGE